MKTITLASEGPNPLDIYSVTLSGTNASRFTATNNCPAILPVSATCTLSVSYAPPTIGYDDTATLTLMDSGNPGEPLRIQLTGSTQ